jgi:hypothetical protein
VAWVLLAACGVERQELHLTAEEDLKNAVLVYSTNANRSPSTKLAEATLSGTVYISSPASARNLRKVAFYLDDPAMAGPAAFIDTSAPFDFAGTSPAGLSNPSDTGAWANGPHLIGMKAFESNGKITSVSASFTVSNAVACSPTTCAAQGKNCGNISDGCGGTLTCGACGEAQTCGGSGVPNVCGTPACTTCTTTLTWNPTIEPRGNIDLPNSLRGQHTWMGQAAQPAGAPGPDGYDRDKVYWGRLEPASGAYNFTWIEEGLAAAKARGGRYGFRVMTYCPGCWMNFRTDWPKVTPAWIPKQPGTEIPAWNSEEFLSGWERLMTELGRRYGNDPRLGWVDIGGYGSYGEWHLSEGGERITDANGLRIVQAVNRAFPNKHLVINAMTSVEFTLAALATNSKLGIRTDCLGAPNMYSMLAVDARLQDRWKTAPIISEWCHSSNTTMAAGAQQVKDFHVSLVSSGNMPFAYTSMTAPEQVAFLDAVMSSGYRYAPTKVEVSGVLRPGTVIQVKTDWANQGSAPTYDAWKVVLKLTNGSGSVVATLPLGTELRSLQSGTMTGADSVTLPNIPAGTYGVSIAVTDPSAYLAPMYLPLSGRTGDGAYPLGSLVLTP